MTAFAEATAQTGAAQGSSFTAFLPMIIIFAIFYFLVIRPQRKTEVKRQEAISKLQPGNLVITNSGIYGKIVALRDKEVDLEIAKNVTIKMLKSNIAHPLEAAAPQK